MTEYFDFCQKIKKEILARNDLIAIISRHMSGDEAECIGTGLQNSHYRIGQLNSGLYVAIRQRKISGKYGISPTFLIIYESYCQRAEELFSLGRRATKFCVGVSKGRNAGILIEDLTDGGKRTIARNAGEIAYFEDNQEEVYVDLDDDTLVTSMSKEERERFLSNLRFMAEDARINL